MISVLPAEKLTVDQAAHKDLGRTHLAPVSWPIYRVKAQIVFECTGSGSSLRSRARMGLSSKKTLVAFCWRAPG